MEIDGPPKGTAGYVGRVFQLDAVELDGELVTIVCDQLRNAFNHLSASFFYDIEPELRASVKLIIGLLSYVRSGSSVGQKMLGLCYASATSQSSSSSWHWGRRRLQLLLMLHVLPEWLLARASCLLTLAGLDTTASYRITRLLEAVARLLALTNTLAFLRLGVYPTLSQRLLQLPTTTTAAAGGGDGGHPAALTLGGTINYSYLSREHLWRGFGELVSCVGPLVDWRHLVRCWTHRLRRYVKPATGTAAVSIGTRPLSASASAAAAGGRGGVSVGRGDGVLVCVVCEQDACLPHVLVCGHTVCYQCGAVEAAVAAGSGAASSTAAGVDPVSGGVVWCVECGAGSDYSAVRSLSCVTAAR